MKKLTVFFFIAVCILSACTKEKSIENSKGINNVDSLLVKTVVVAGPDSLITTFGYDGNRRLVTFSTAGDFGSTPFNSQTSFERNNDGIIQRVIIESSRSGSNDIVYNLNYSAADSRYTYALRIDSTSGIEKDSIAYTYDNTGKMIKEEEFYDDGTTGGYAESSKNEYTYDGNGNIIKAMSSEYDATAGSYSLTSETDYEYDAKVNPLKLSIEAFFVQSPELVSSSNVTKRTTKDYTDPTLDDTITFTYNYNGEGKPDTASVTYQSLGIPFTGTYYYQ